MPTSFRILDEFVAAGFYLHRHCRWAFDVGAGPHGRRIRNPSSASGPGSAANRAKVVLATKVGWQMPPDGSGLSRAYIVRAVEDSLRRLQTDYIDLYQAHVDDADTSLEETLAAFGDLIRQGKVRAIGASNYSARG